MRIPQWHASVAPSIHHVDGRQLLPQSLAGREVGVEAVGVAVHGDAIGIAPLDQRLFKAVERQAAETLVERFGDKFVATLHARALEQMIARLSQCGAFMRVLR